MITWGTYLWLVSFFIHPCLIKKIRFIWSMTVPTLLHNNYNLQFFSIFNVLGNQDQSNIYSNKRNKDIILTLFHNCDIYVTIAQDHCITFITAMSTGKMKAVFDSHMSLVCTTWHSVLLYKASYNNTIHLAIILTFLPSSGSIRVHLWGRRREKVKIKATLSSHTYTPAQLHFF